MSRELEYKANIQTLIMQYRTSLLDDSDAEKKAILDALLSEPSLENVKRMTAEASSLFLDSNLGNQFLSALTELNRKHQTYLYWGKVKNVIYAGHLSERSLERVLETYQSAKGIGIDLPPQAPMQSIKPNLKMFKEYRSTLKPEFHAHANAVLKNLDKISFPQLKSLLKNLAGQLNQHIEANDYQSIYFLCRGKQKSEHWILQLIYPFLNFRANGVIEIPEGTDLSSSKNQDVTLKLGEALRSKDSCLILIDDGTYSGCQCGDHIVNIALRLDDMYKSKPGDFNETSIELIFAFAYVTQQAMGLINNSLNLINEHSLLSCDIHNLIKRTHLFYEKKILSIKEINWGELQADYQATISTMLADSDTLERRENSLTTVYTDWRTPDGFSSSERFFKGVPPTLLCREEKKSEQALRQHKYINDDERIIPTNFRSPYK